MGTRLRELSYSWMQPQWPGVFFGAHGHRLWFVWAATEADHVSGCLDGAVNGGMGERHSTDCVQPRRPLESNPKPHQDGKLQVTLLWPSCASEEALHFLPKHLWAQGVSRPSAVGHISPRRGARKSAYPASPGPFQQIIGGLSEYVHTCFSDGRP